MSGSVELVPPSGQEGRIFLLRGTRVMLDGDLAALYGVDTKVLNQAVRRNLERFPADFMFQLTAEEHAALRSQSVTLGSGRGKHAKYLPLAFTEQGVAMLSSVLRSPRAIRVNIELMRAFVRLRAMAIAHHELARKVEVLERKYDGQLKVVFQALRQIMAPAGAKARRIGFRGGKPS